MNSPAKITIPYAIANYNEMRTRGFYYVDKTMFIPDLESYKALVFLRPCRFGKSLMVSMLAHYYDRRKDDAEQVKSYAATIKKRFPNFNVRTYVAYIVANKGYKFWESP